MYFSPVLVWPCRCTLRPLRDLSIFPEINSEIGLPLVSALSLHRAVTHSNWTRGQRWLTILTLTWWVIWKFITHVHIRMLKFSHGQCWNPAWDKLPSTVTFVRRPAPSRPDRHLPGHLTHLKWWKYNYWAEVRFISLSSSLNKNQILAKTAISEFILILFS